MSVNILDKLNKIDDDDDDDGGGGGDDDADDVVTDGEHSDIRELL